MLFKRDISIMIPFLLVPRHGMQLDLIRKRIKIVHVLKKKRIKEGLTKIVSDKVTCNV